MASVNKAAVNAHVQGLVWAGTSAYLGDWSPRSLTAGSYGNDMFDFLNHRRLSTEWLYLLALRPAMRESSCSFTSLPVFGGISGLWPFKQVYTGISWLFQFAFP